MRVRPVLLTAFAILSIIFPQRVRGQVGICSIDPPCPTGAPPKVHLSPKTGTVVKTPYVDLSVTMMADTSMNLSSLVMPASFSGSWYVHNTDGIFSGRETLVSGPNTFIVDVADIFGNHGADTVVITYDAPPLPNTVDSAFLSLAPYSNTVRRIAGCSGCIYGSYSYSTPAYVSRDVPRSVTLMYSSSQAQPRILVQLDANVHTTTVPDYISIQLDSGITPVSLTNGGHAAWYAGDTGTVRVAAQRDASAMMTGWYDETAEVRTWWSGVSHAAFQRLRAFVINEQTSYVGAGWSISGLERLWPQSDSVAITDGTGGIVFFARTGSTTFATPNGDFTTLTLGGCPGACVYTRTSPDGTAARFDATGLLTTVITRFGDSTHYAYSSSQLTSITDEAGQTTTLSYAGASGCLSGTKSATLCMITTPGGRKTRLFVDSLGNLTQIIDPDSVTAFTGTYSNHLLRTASDRLGATTTFGYDAFTDLASLTLPSVTVTDVSGGTSAVASVINYSPIEYRLLATDDSSSSTARSRVFADQAYVTVTAPNGTVTGMILQGAGEPTRVVVDPLIGAEQLTNTVYDSAYRPISVTQAPVGGTTTYTWSGAVPVTSVDASGTLSAYSYTTYNQLTALTLGGVVQQTNFYSGAYTTLDSSVVGSARTRYHWDSHGRLTGTNDRNSDSTSTVYESGGFQNTSQSIVSLSGSTTIVHDQYGRDSVVTDPLSYVTTTTYDILNRSKSITQPGSATTTFGYHEDASAHTETDTLTDARGVKFISTNNALGLTTTSIDPQGHTTTIGYDKNEQVSRSVDRLGTVFTFTYDSLGRVKTQIAGTDTTTFAYDLSTLVSDYHYAVATNALTKDSLATDAQGRPAEFHRTLGGLGLYSEIAYDDAASNRTSLSVGTSGWVRSLTFTYDSLERRKLLPDWGGGYTRISYNSIQMLDTLRFPTGADSAHRLKIRPYSYSPTGRPAFVDVYAGSFVVQSWTYSYDGPGRLTMIHSGSDREYTERHFNYDARNRLASWADTLVYADSTQEDCPDHQIICDPPAPWDLTWYQTQIAGHAATYNPDYSGNRTDGSAAITSNENRLTSMTGADGNAYTFTYDTLGRMTTKARSGVTQEFHWNTLSQLAWVRTNSDTVFYGYDANGLRVKKTHGGTTTYYVWDGDDMVMQLDGSGNRTLEYAYAGTDQPISVLTGGKRYYYQLDQQGNTVAVWDTTNTAVATYDYDPYGYSLGTTGSFVQPLRWKGAQFDSTGLYYMRARYYDPAIGRFLSEDPIGLAGGTNSYTFADGEPVNSVDPSGLTPVCTLVLVKREAFVTSGSFLQGYDPGVYKKVCTEPDAPKPPQPPIPPGGPNPPPAPPKLCTGGAQDASDEQRAAILAAARAQLNVRYFTGGGERSSPAAGFDCSGLVNYCLRAAGLQVPYRTTGNFLAGKYQYVRTIDPSELIPGDLLLFDGHIGIWDPVGGTSASPVLSARSGLAQRVAYAPARYFGSFTALRVTVSCQ